MKDQQFRILVIEDNLVDVRLIQDALHQVGLPHELVTVSDGEQALAFVQRKGRYVEALAPHIVLLDLNLPKYDGIAVLEAIRTSEHLSDVAVIIISSSRSKKERTRLEELGAEMFWTKPLSLDGFLDLAGIVKAVAMGGKAPHSEGQP